MSNVAGERKRNQTRPSAKARGYGPAFNRLRRRWARIVPGGQVECPRCLMLIEPGEPWDLGHDEYDRENLTLCKPEHRYCNRRAGGRNGGRKRARNAKARAWSRDWF